MTYEELIPADDATADEVVDLMCKAYVKSGPQMVGFPLSLYVVGSGSAEELIQALRRRRHELADTGILSIVKQIMMVAPDSPLELLGDCAE